MYYLKVCWLVTISFGIFQLSLVSDCWFNSARAWEHTLYDFYSLKCVKVCCMAQNVVFLGDCSMWAWAECVFCFWIKFYKYQLNPVGWLLCSSTISLHSTVHQFKYMSCWYPLLPLVKTPALELFLPECQQWILPKRLQLRMLLLPWIHDLQSQTGPITSH